MLRVLIPNHDAHLKVSALARAYSTSTTDSKFNSDLMRSPIARNYTYVLPYVLPLTIFVMLV